MQDKIIRLRKGKKGFLRPAHPWIFKGQILKVDSGIKPGELASVLTNEGKFVGRGYYNDASSIAVRLLSFRDEIINEPFFFKRIKEALDRRGFLANTTNAKRLIFSEADGLPGLIADQYNDTLVVQIFTLGMENLKELIFQVLADIINPKYIYEKSDSHFRKMESLKVVKKWRLNEGSPEVEIYEGGARFMVDIEKGHKTGFYLDQRRSRLAMPSISKGKTVLDLFCYTGAFAINAALGGASKVTAVDIKQEWLSLGARNAALNDISDKIVYKVGDAFAVLKSICNSGERFDIIILDPPSFTRDRGSLVSAAKGYKELNSLAMRSLTDGGVLCTFSCSHNMTNNIFSKMIKDSAIAAKKSCAILKRCRQDKDHPIIGSVPETEYLKGYFLKIGG